jgi:hypothetical protein
VFDRRPEGDGIVMGIAARTVRIASSLVPLGLSVVLATSASAAGYRDTGLDGRESGAYLDVRSTTRSVFSMPDGHRSLRIVVRSWEPWETFTTFFRASVPLDTRGGPGADRTIVISVGDAGSGDAPGCRIQGDGSHPGTLFLNSSDGLVACTVPIRFANPTKRIRWFVVTDSFYGPTPTSKDRAPDSGWYA